MEQPADFIERQSQGASTREARLKTAIQEACDLLAERTQGSPARSPGHNARLLLERALGVEDPTLCWHTEDLPEA